MSTPNTVEVIRFTVKEEHAAAALAKRQEVDAWVHSLAGHIKTETIQLGQDQWLFLVYWQNAEAMAAAQKQTGPSALMNDWIALTDGFVSFEQGPLIYTY
jgi:antibiotic biosynthesis monooxygenase (ABM) superfamily enzyme